MVRYFELIQVEATGQAALSSDVLDKKLETVVIVMLFSSSCDIPNLCGIFLKITMNN